MATIVGPYGAISSGVVSQGASPSGYVSLGSFTATSGGLLPNASSGPATASGTVTQMGVHYLGAISAPFVGGSSPANVGTLAVNEGLLPNASMGPASLLYANFSQQGYVNARGYLYYQSSLVQVSAKMNGQATVYNSFEQKDNGSFQLFAAMTAAGWGESRILEGIAQKSIGEARVLVLVETKGAGKAVWYNNFEVTDWGQFNVEFTSISAKMIGSSFIMGPFSQTVRGQSRVLIACAITDQGYYGRQAAIAVQMIGKSRVIIGFATALKGRYGSSTSFQGLGLKGVHRKQNSTTAGWVAYVGAGGPPNFNAAPAVYSASFPLEVPLAPPLSGTLTYYVVIRKRNSYGVESQNQQPVLVTLDTAGNRILQPLASPTNVSVSVNPDAKVMVAAEYPELLTADDPADKWRIWISSGTINTNDPATRELEISRSRIVSLFEGIAAGTYNYKVGVYRTEDDALNVVSGTVVVPAAPAEPVPVQGMSIILES